MRIKKDCQVSEVAGENIILLQGNDTIDTTKLLSLNETSLWLWEQIQETDFTEQSISELLMAEFEVDKDSALSDAQSWIATLRKFELIVE